MVDNRMDASDDRMDTGDARWGGEDVAGYLELTEMTKPGYGRVPGSKFSHNPSESPSLWHPGLNYLSRRFIFR